MGKTLRTFSNKSKKDKKNAIRRKTKGNRRNNKRRTYRKKVKGGDVTHPAAQTVMELVNDLETNVNNLINVISSITIENISGMNDKEIRQVAAEVSIRLGLVKNSLEKLGQDKKRCGFVVKDQDCEESKKNSYIKAVKNMRELKNAAEEKLKDLNTIDSKKGTIEFLKEIIRSVIKIATTGKGEEKKNFTAIVKKATTRGATDAELGYEKEEENASLDTIYPYNETVVDMTTENPLNA